MHKLRVLLRRVFIENVTIKVVALLVTLLLFYFVREGKQDAKTLALDIELSIPRGVVQTNEIARQVQVKIAGPKAMVDTLSEESVGPLSIDLSPFGIGASTLFLHQEMFPNIPSGVSIASIRPSYIAVRIEKEVSRVLPVTPILKGQVAHGYRIDRYTLSDREATLIGPTSLVDRTDYLETAPIDISGATKTRVREVPIRLPAPSTRLSTTEPIAVTVHIVEEVIERTLEGVPVGAPGVDGAEVEPREVTVTLKGPLRLVEPLKPADLKARVALDPAQVKVGHQRTVVVLDGLPTGVVQVGEPPKVTLVVEPGGRPGGRRGGAKGEGADARGGQPAPDQGK